MRTRKTVIITGDRGGGKTHFITNLFEFLSLFENQICGFVSKGIFDEDGRKEFVLKDLSSGQEFPLASRTPKEGYENTGRFWFNPAAVTHGESIMKKAVEEKCKVLIIDEMGPVELAGGAWHNGFVNVFANYQGILVFSTRETMLEKLIEKYGIHEAFIENIGTTTPRKTGDSIISMLNLHQPAPGHDLEQQTE
ncbi:MAG TPA: nucleoside-triphosphatase [Bacteroidales bacterium]|nr:nucleoside-triphosphatase [Bacteroidales bacterium]